MSTKQSLPLTLLDIVHPCTLDLEIAGLVGEPRQVLEALIGRPQDRHGWLWAAARLSLDLPAG